MSRKELFRILFGIFKFDINKIQKKNCGLKLHQIRSLIVLQKNHDFNFRIFISTTMLQSEM